MMVATTVRRSENSVPFLLRVVWFFAIGWHVSLYWILAAWLLNLTLIGLPLGLWMLNRVPLVMTLRSPVFYSVTYHHGGEMVGWSQVGLRQHGWLTRLVYFLVVGWWASLLWSILAWLLCVSVIGLPVGAWMFNRLPGITTLSRD
jgi:uncharacterized membrane protein YccF (DUF307 family)